MKINWGTGIVIAFALFITFILYFVFKVQSDSQYDNELVVEEYYKQELKFENQMTKEQNAIDMTEKISISTSEEGINITFPSDLDLTKVTGKVSLYRPSNQKLDFEVPISLSGPHLLIPKSNLVGGRWDISLDWSYDGKDFLNKKTIYF
ncbi:FixH family protein [Flavobacterium sp.]|uniref:FixH family protein n=1 Tax=Flavobacterium sp. TaxID=239 RepID=UPI0025BE5F9E|nr:FixH family protein [Flavobacterium sp.]MBA4154492.1 cytochrome C oxidase Cbb3 [Flavobacterium sp.]